jgi:hypothetical protein
MKPDGSAGVSILHITVNFFGINEISPIGQLDRCEISVLLETV